MATNNVITVKIPGYELVKAKGQIADFIDNSIPINMIGVDIVLERSPYDICYNAHVTVERKMEGAQYLLF